MKFLFLITLTLSGVLLSSLSSANESSRESNASQPFAHDNSIVRFDRTTKLNKDIRWSLSFTLPELIRLQAHLPVGINQIRLFAGGLPLDRLLGIDQHFSKYDLGPDYNIEISPRTFIFSSGVAWDIALTENRHYLSLEFSLMQIVAGGSGQLINSDTQQRMPFVSLEAAIYQPLFKIGYIQQTHSHWRYGVWLSYFMPLAIEKRLGGPFPALLEVAPEYRSAIHDGSDAAHTALADNLKKVFIPYRLLPSICIAYLF